ncbi:MAG: glycosyltransferase family 2 protein [Cyclobacteriaceae bacterium]|nr:glycosyltransferase family 2 protein [Cyclobacteriaceae bacterium]
MTDKIFSIICPVLNEERHIEGIISSFINNCPQPSELFIADAGSTDRTREIVLKWSKDYPAIFLIDNPKKYVSFAFNTCYGKSSGKYLALLGAHTIYSDSFFKQALSYFETAECDAVGGPLVQTANTNTGKSIAYCMSTKFGVGGTEFRTSVAKQYVDSVAFAFYRREVFEKIGLMDEQLIRNQDDEFHYRMNAAGLRILMVPEMQCVYYVRETLSGLFKQYFQYGLFKPLVLKKVKAGIRARHLIPACFVLYLLTLFPAIFFIGWLALIPMILYVIFDVYFSFKANLSLQLKIKACTVFPVLHISYGTGFLLGLKKLVNE